MSHLQIPGFPIKVGSCTFDVQEVLDLIPKGMCDKFAPAGQPCTLPLAPGYYGDSDPNGSADVVVPDVPAIIAPLLNGALNVKVKVVDPNGNDMVCLQDKLMIKA